MRRQATQVTKVGVSLVAVLFALIAVVSSGPGPVAAQSESEDLAPGNGTVIHVARPTWDTGWFQAEVITQLLAELGYVIDGPATYNNDDFYSAVKDGDVDLWVNGWFPLHNHLVDEGPNARSRAVGFEVRGGALQGYAADMATVESAGIESLADLTDPEIAALFDGNGNGKADLIGCNTDWICHQIVEHHLDAYGLNETVEQISADYGPLMEAAVQRFGDDEPLLYYTYTPNWTSGVLVPGTDVSWLPVPFPSLPEALAADEPDTIVPGIIGCPDPCAMGFPPNDIRSVANTQLLESEPAIASLLEQFTIALSDISSQNASMFNGEDSSVDIVDHAEDWMQSNRDTVDIWLAAATQAHVDAGLELGPIPAFSDANRVDVGTIRVATRTAAPFVSYADDTYGGFTIELLNLVAEQVGAEIEIYGVTSNAKLIDDVARGEADVGASAIAITSQREEQIDFSQPYFDSGLEIMVPSESGGIFGGRLEAVARTLFSLDVLVVILSLLVVLFAAAHIVWLAERKTNPEFPQAYWPGVWEAFWWAAVTATTVGYGDKTPKGVIGRLFGLLWMFMGLFVLAYFTAGIASAFTLDELQGRISGPADLRGHEVGVIADSLGDEYLKSQGIPAVEYVSGDEAYRALSDGALDAVVHDAAILQHHLTTNDDGDAEIVGLVFAERGFGFAVAQGSDMAEAINRGLISIIESGEYAELYEEWFGTER